MRVVPNLSLLLMNISEAHKDFEPISVIVPVQNEAESIRALLQGLYAQTHQPAEIVIADGGNRLHVKVRCSLKGLPPREQLECGPSDLRQAIRPA